MIEGYLYRSFFNVLYVSDAYIPMDVYEYFSEILENLPEFQGEYLRFLVETRRAVEHLKAPHVPYELLYFG